MAALQPYSSLMRTFEDFLNLTSKDNSQLLDKEPIHFEDWKKERKSKEKVRDSIVSLFDISKLSRKGQKKYKEETVRGFNRKKSK